MRPASGHPVNGVFAEHAPAYAAAGLPVFPVDTRHKRPVVRNWHRSGIPATLEWIGRYGDADGLGLCMGEKSRLVEVDVDVVGGAALAAARERFGDTPVTIRTASGKGKLWYRHSGEGRRIRLPGGLPIDILGAGLTIAPPSYRPDLGQSYGFLTGSLADLDRLPPIRPGALDVGRGRAAEAVREGERNDVLWRWCMVEARFCDEADALIDAAQTWASAMPVPLDPREVERAARSAWSYEVSNRNFVGLRCPQITPRDRAMDDLSDEPDAYWLLDLFRRYHSNRSGFRISPAAMSRDRNPPWHVTRIRRARDVLIERGHVLVLAPPDGRRRRPGLYGLTRSDSVLNHFTPSPLPSRGVDGGRSHLPAGAGRHSLGSASHG